MVTHRRILCPSVTTKTHTLISLSRKQLTRSGRFEASGLPSPQMKPSDNGSALVRDPTTSICQRVHRGICTSMPVINIIHNQIRFLEKLFLPCALFSQLKQDEKSNPTKPQRRDTGTSPQSDGKQVEASPEKTLTAITVCHALCTAFTNAPSFGLVAQCDRS